MKVALVYPDFSIGSKGKFYHGIAHISAALKKSGHKTFLIHLINEMSESNFVQIINQEKPDLIAFSSTTNMFSYVEKYAGYVKKNFDLPVLCGGIHPTLDPDGSINSEVIDMICIGEGEEAIVELCDRIEKNKDFTDIKNLWVKKDNEIHKNHLRPLKENLDELPFADRDIFDYKNLEDAKLKRTVFMASRGCPYECSFCSNHQLKKIYSGKYVRFRSVNNVLEEVKKIIEIEKPEYVVFHDDILTLNKKWLNEFTARWKEEINLPFSCNSRVDLLDEVSVKMLKEANCFEISMGLESGNDYIREKVLNRRMKREDIINAFRLCQKYGINTVSYNMIGLPFEDMSMILDTIKLNALINPTNLQVSIFYPFPHTRLFDECENNKFLTGKNLNSYFEDTIINQPSITHDQVNFAFWYVRRMLKIYSFNYKLPKIISGITEKILDKIFESKSLASFVVKAKKSQVTSRKS
ncbi:MAG: B12-binding domain-containing radical SAM protein [Actinobacteria bacterium]|nr:B12-binding domain-containing radical SAM protein [Actinomycetota bacterium]